MRLLVVSFLYAPRVSPRAFRWTAIAEHWAAAGHEVTVLAGFSPGLARDERLAGVRVLRPGGGLSERLRGTLLRPATSSSGASAGAPAGSETSLLRTIHDLTWKRLYWPDASCLWYPPARRRLGRLLTGYAPEAVITVSHPFTSHLLGLRVRRRSPGARWLVDIGDPFAFLDGTPPNNRALYRRLNYRAERAVLTAAHVTAVTTEATRERYAAEFPAAAAKISVIPPLLPPAAATGSARADGAFFPGDGRTRLVFVGTLYRGIRSPEPLLRLFQRLLASPDGERLELHFLGSLHDAAPCFVPHRGLLGTRLFLHGPVAHTAAVQATREADVLVNLGNDVPYQLPSKVVEYAASGNPVINLATRADDPSREFFAAYPAALDLVLAGGEPSDAQVDAARAFVAKPRRVDAARLAAFLAPFRIESIALAYERLLQPGGARR